DDQGSVASQFQGEALHPLRRSADQLLPVSVEPVKDTLRTRGSAIIARPMAPASPVTRLAAPGGRPASSSSFSKATAVRGVWLAGFSTTVHPAARAAAILRVTIVAG